MTITALIPKNEEKTNTPSQQNSISMEIWQAIAKQKISRFYHLKKMLVLTSEQSGNMKQSAQYGMFCPLLKHTGSDVTLAGESPGHPWIPAWVPATNTKYIPRQN